MHWMLLTAIASAGSLLGAILGTLMFAVPRKRELRQLRFDMVRLQVEHNIHVGEHNALLEHMGQTWNPESQHDDNS